jgi:hypothetical protein
MPFTYERDDERRLVTVTVTDPYSEDDIFAVVERQAADGVWEYALLYDLRAVAELITLDPAIVKARLLEIGGGRPRGASALIVGAHPDWFRTAMRYSLGIAEVQEFEVLVTPEQMAGGSTR